MNQAGANLDFNFNKHVRRNCNQYVEERINRAVSAGGRTFDDNSDAITSILRLKEPRKKPCAAYGGYLASGNYLSNLLHSSYLSVSTMIGRKTYPTVTVRMIPGAYPVCAIEMWKHHGRPI